jgi:hypothetical protein
VQDDELDTDPAEIEQRGTNSESGEASVDEGSFLVA